MRAGNEIEGLLESSPYIWLMLPPKENTLQYEYVFFIYATCRKCYISILFLPKKNLQGI